MHFIEQFCMNFLLAHIRARRSLNKINKSNSVNFIFAYCLNRKENNVFTLCNSENWQNFYLWIENSSFVARAPREMKCSTQSEGKKNVAKLSKRRSKTESKQNQTQYFLLQRPADVGLDLDCMWNGGAHKYFLKWYENSITKCWADWNLNMRRSIFVCVSTSEFQFLYQNDIKPQSRPATLSHSEWTFFMLAVEISDCFPRTKLRLDLSVFDFLPARWHSKPTYIVMWSVETNVMTFSFKCNRSSCLR